MKLAEVYKSFFESKSRYCVLYGGAGSGKSEHTARKLFLRSIAEGGHNWLIIRKFATTLRDSVMKTIREAIESEGVKLVEKTQQKKFWVTNNCFNFYGLDNSEKLKSIKGITGIWIEEASELTREDFLQVDLRLRGETKNYKQIVLTFNPVASAFWIKEMFLDTKRDDVFVLKTTVEDNPFIDSEYKTVLKNIADEYYKKTYLFGEWQEKLNNVFSNYFVTEYTLNDFDYYGADFGFNNPTAVVGVKETENGLIVKELLYSKGFTQDDLRDWFLNNVEKNKQVFCDSSEPARIEDLKRVGYKAIAANKNVLDGIMYLKTKKLFIDGANLLKEIQKYSWERKRGVVLDSPVKIDDHLVDAMRYAVWTKYTLRGLNNDSIKNIKSVVMRVNYGY